MNVPTHPSLVLAALMLCSASVLAQRHDAAGTSHGTVRVNGSGVIRAVDVSSGIITLEHETINKFKLEEATHEFKVKDRRTLRNLKSGDRVNFKLQSAGQDLLVVQVSKLK